MSHPNTPTQDIPVTVTPSPATMPGARVDTIPAVSNPESRAPQAGVVEGTPQKQEPPKQQEPKQQEPQQDPPKTPAETVEMERFKAVQQIARQNEDDARAYRKLLEGLGVKPEDKSEFDPQAEITKLRNDFQEERDGRIREQISHTTGVPVDQIQGTDRESMQASAQRALDWVNGVLKKANVPATAPASTVTSSQGPNDGSPQQLSRGELATMTPAQVLEADRAGRLDNIKKGIT